MQHPTDNAAPGDPWHQGERALHQHLGVSERMATLGPKVIRPFMPEQHRVFYQQLPFLLSGVVDEQNRPWATVLSGIPGFITSPNDRMLSINAAPAPGDPALAGFRSGAGIGLLGIDLQSRRRNRANGQIVSLGDQSVQVTVQQTMGNCPKYIQTRTEHRLGDARAWPVAHPIVSTELNAQALEQIQGADTFYVASYADSGTERQVDVSHRGGNAGFVRVDDQGTLTIPDFKGNRFFNTLGNIHSTGKAGLIFIDHHNGNVLQMSGEAQVQLDATQGSLFAGAERLWSFKPTTIVERKEALPMRWDLEETSPHLAETGSWVHSA